MEHCTITCTSVMGASASIRLRKQAYALPASKVFECLDARLPSGHACADLEMETFL